VIVLQGAKILAVRRKTSQVKIQDGLFIGSEHPIVVQSMTNTPTTDIERTAAQIKDLYLAGSSMVRLTIKDEASARVIPLINSKLRADGLEIPLVGDFHYNGHLLLDQFPECASTLAKYRINPGNVGYGDKHDYNFDTIIKIAKANDKAVRIGVNWGSLDQDLLTEFMDKNNRHCESKGRGNPEPLSFKQVIYQAMKESALRSAELAMQAGLAEDKIIISVKMSEVHDLINVYREVAKSCNFPLHLGLTEAGTPVKGMISSSAALAILLNEGIGDTIRMSLTPSAGTGELADRCLEVRACQELLQALELEFFKPSITSCPGCGRTSSTYFQQLAEEINQHVLEQINTWKPKYPGVEKLKIAVMGCIVNGPGESKYADIGISLPGDNEDPVAPVYIDGKLHTTLRGDDISNEFKEILDNYIESSFQQKQLRVAS
jgi:(E)-4-hydroxy-3-methylbut-2-enyl-diphosphate synthase